MVRATSKTSAPAPAPVVSTASVDAKKPVAKKPSAPKTSEKKAPEPVPLEISIPETLVEGEVADKSSVAALLLEEKNQAHANFQLIMNTVAALKVNMKNIDKMTSRVMKDAAKSTKHKKKSSGLSGFEKPTLISDELALFFGKDKDTKMARTEVSKLIHEYVKKENLQKEGNRRVIRPDNKLQKLLVIDATKEELTYFNLQKYLKKHFRKEVV
jgi:chromatin remodeling complex protein RSC6